jgi:hypothetical protein
MDLDIWSCKMTTNIKVNKKTKWGKTSAGISMAKTLGQTLAGGLTWAILILLIGGLTLAGPYIG